MVLKRLFLKNYLDNRNVRKGKRMKKSEQKFALKGYKLKII